MRPNQIAAAFESLSRTVSSRRDEGSGQVPASERRRDTMHLVFERMMSKGKSSRFTLDHAEPISEEESSDFEIATFAITECGISDFRTVAIVDATFATRPFGQYNAQ